MQEIRDCFLDPEGAQEALTDLLDVIRHRYQEIAKGNEFGRYELVLLRPENIWYRSKAVGTAVAIARLGRSANVGLVLRTDAPDAANAYGFIDRLPITLVGSVELRDLIEMQATLGNDWTVQFEYRRILTPNA